MKKKLLIIGGHGFVGSHLKILATPKYEIKVSGRENDVKDFNKIKELILRVRPDFVINLASITTIEESILDPLESHLTSFLGTFNILSSLRESKFKGCFIYVSSSEVYGGAPTFNELPIKESSIARPLNPYGVSKFASEALCYQWSKVEDFRIVVARPFNHIGPGQNERFAISNFARQIIGIKLKGLKPILSVGEIEVFRDFTDVRDVARAYILLLEFGKSGDIYNVCSSKEISVRDILKKMIECTNMEIDIKIEKSRVRSSQNKHFYGSYDKIFQDTGWKPQITIDETLEDIMQYWENKLGREA